jgi:hypothetical protein
MSQSIAFVGSRSFSNAALVSQVVAAVLPSGASLRVGCCVGADALVLSAVVAAGAASRLSVFSVFAPGGVGALPSSAVSAVHHAFLAGARVSWRVGSRGGLPLPVRARLAVRSRWVVGGASVVVCFWSGSPRFRSGSLVAAAFGVAQGAQLVAFGGRPPALPSLAGVWVAGVFSGLSCWRWSPGQAVLL